MRNVSSEPRLSGFDETRDFIRGHIVKPVPDAVIELPVDVGVKALHHRSQKDGRVRFGAAVRMNFDEYPVGPSADSNGHIDPCRKALAGGQMSRRAVDGGVLESGQQPPNAAPHVEGQGPLNDQESGVRRRMSDSSGDADVVRAGPQGIVRGVVDAVDRTCLRWIRRCREREVGVTTGLSEDSDFVIDPAKFSVWTGVVQSPVAVDKSECDRAVTAPAQQAVPVEERLGETAEAIPQRLRSVMVVVKMDFNVSESETAQPGQWIDERWMIAFLREEERVLWRTSVVVRELPRECWILFHPRGHTISLRSEIDASMIRFEVVGDAKKNVCRGAVHLRAKGPA